MQNSRSISIIKIFQNLYRILFQPIIRFAKCLMKKVEFLTILKVELINQVELV